MFTSLFRTLILFCILWSPNLQAEPIQVDLFVSSTCSHCQKASAFMDELTQTHPWIQTEKYVINQDTDALMLFSKRLQALNERDFQVPSLFFCGIRWAGFDTAEKSGKRILKALQFCHDNITDSGEISAATRRTLQQWSMANLLEERTQNPRNSLIQNIVVLALADAFSICAWFCLALFLAVMVLSRTPVNQIKTGLAMMAGMFSVHYLQQFHPDQYFQLLYHIILPGILIAILMIYKILRGFTWSLWQLLLLAIFTVCVFAWQQSCPASWAEANAVWLLQQEAGFWSFFVYELIYALPLLALLLLCLYLAKTQWYQSWQNAIQFACIPVLLAIALCLLIYPSGLANENLSSLLPIIFLIGLIVGRFWRKNGH